VPGSFVSDLIKAAVIDLLFKRPITVQFGRDATGKIDFRANINPSSGGGQPPVVYMAPQPSYPYAGYPPQFMPPGYSQPGYPPQYQPQYQQPSQPPISGAPNPPEQKQQAEFDLNIPAFVRR